MTVRHRTIPWLRLDGIDHALALVVHGWHYTACRTFTPNGRVIASPRRKCRKCVRALKSAVRSPGIVSADAN